LANQFVGNQSRNGRDPMIKKESNQRLALAYCLRRRQRKSIRKQPQTTKDKMSKYKVHPFAAKFPMVAANELQELADNIKANGQRIPGVVKDGELIDGRNREAACKLAGVEFEVEEWNEKRHGKSVIDFILSINTQRRHLTVSQRATIAADSLPFFEAEAKARQSLSKGGGVAGAKEAVETGTAAEHAASKSGVSVTSVKTAKRLKTEAPDEFKKVQKGEKTLANAAKKLKPKAPKKAEPKPDLADKFMKAVKSIRSVTDGSFAQALSTGALLNQKDTIKLADMTDDEIQRVKALLQANPTWTLKKAADYKGEKLESKHKIQDLINVAASKGGKHTCTISGYEFTVRKQ
jgi:ParB-like chromosome segregation protein Spo0J